MGSGEGDAGRPVVPHRGTDAFGRYVYRCAHCRNEIGTRGGDWVHLEPTNRCRTVVPYRASQ